MKKNTDCEESRIANMLRIALFVGEMEEIEMCEERISELGLEWAAVFNDGLVSNNAKWIHDHRHEGTAIDHVVVGRGIWE